MLSLFEGFGIELEYMIVDRDGLDVRPVADRLLEQVGGDGCTEVEQGDLAWSNELALHVIEMKTNGPVPSLANLAPRFQGEVERMNDLLVSLGARLMPTGMHPWMDPERELKLWPHENDRIYAAFDRIFDCRGHGWANLQSMHINLSFANDDDFARLHAAVRLVLPILPALAASSPIADGRLTGTLDTRVAAYRDNARRVPSVTGLVIPERVFDRTGYEREILERIYADMAASDPEGVLRHEWINARGCIARFDRMALEIRLLDTQECPRADLAVARAVVEVVRMLVEERHASLAEQMAADETALAESLLRCTRDAGRAGIADPYYLRMLGWTGDPVAAGELWAHLLGHVLPADAADVGCLQTILTRGCLARRIAAAAGLDPSRARLEGIYRRLCDCLARGELFDAADV